MDKLAELVEKTKKGGSDDFSKAKEIFKELYVASSAVAKSEVPKHYVCPISREVMKDPVIVSSSGVTYERKYIESWMNAGFNWDFTSEKSLSNKELVPNEILKEIILEWEEGKEDYADKIPDDAQRSFCVVMYHYLEYVGLKSVAASFLRESKLLDSQVPPLSTLGDITSSVRKLVGYLKSQDEIFGDVIDDPIVRIPDNSGYDLELPAEGGGVGVGYELELPAEGGGVGVGYELELPAEGGGVGVGYELELPAEGGGVGVGYELELPAEGGGVGVGYEHELPAEGGGVEAVPAEGVGEQNLAVGGEVPAEGTVAEGAIQSHTELPAYDKNVTPDELRKGRFGLYTSKENFLSNFEDGEVYDMFDRDTGERHSVKFVARGDKVYRRFENLKGYFHEKKIRAGMKLKFEIENEKLYVSLLRR